MQKPRETEFILIQHIDVKDRLRPINEDGVKALMASMEKIGLRTPITVRVNPADENPDVFLVSGRHRLEAARRLGWDEIECFVAEEADEGRARMWEIAENLHRAELTALERSEQIAEWIRLSESLFHGETGTRAAARNLNLAPATIHRAQKISAMSDEAKATATELGVENSTRLLMEASRAEPEKQASVLREIAERKASKIDLDVKDRAANEVAQIIAEYVPGDAWDALKANLYAAGANNIANALTNITGQSIMDRRYA